MTNETMSGPIRINRLTDNVAEKVGALRDDAWVYVVQHSISKLAGDDDDNTVRVLAAGQDRAFLFVDGEGQVCLERTKAGVIKYIEEYMT